jgi:hypothetical protein
VICVKGFKVYFMYFAFDLKSSFTHRTFVYTETEFELLFSFLCFLIRYKEGFIVSNKFPGKKPNLRYSPYGK